MTGFHACVAGWLRGGKDCQDTWKVVLDRVERRRLRDGEHGNSWDPVGEFGAENGRYGTTAMATLMLQVCNRFSRLEVCSGD